MKRVLMLGSGLVSRPIARYLLEQAGLKLTVASLELDQAQALIAGHPHGEALLLNVDDEAALSGLVAQADVVVSLLPATHHVIVAKQCIAHRKHMVTTSYVSEPMAALDADARAAGLLLLNEIGVDPGLDHMSAMQVIHEVERAGAKVVSFRSYCGGLPAPEHNDNPWGYKLSWSPRGAVLAARRMARYLENREVVEVPVPDLFSTIRHLQVDGLGILEAYANGDALSYIDTYGLRDVETMYRGTLRWPGHCQTWLALRRAGLFDVDQRIGMKEKTLADFMASIAHAEPSQARQAIARKVRMPVHSDPLRRMEWLGLFSDQKIGVDTISPLDLLVKLLGEKLHYAPGEVDMIAMCHRFVTETEGERAQIDAQLVELGIPDGDSAMARLVSLPAAIATRLICEEKIALTGVHIPVDPAIYQPVLAGLAKENISFTETRRPL